MRLNGETAHVAGPTAQDEPGERPEGDDDPPHERPESRHRAGHDDQSHDRAEKRKAELSMNEPVNGIVEPAGPDEFRLDELGRAS
jgi:hypothetical protein